MQYEILAKSGAPGENLVRRMHGNGMLREYKKKE